MSVMNELPKQSKIGDSRGYFAQLQADGDGFIFHHVVWSPPRHILSIIKITVDFSTMSYHIDLTIVCVCELFLGGTY